ncbi:HDOD domain-containing protein [bacterium]|nr:HDOD domain-containing protein [bacterium]
MAYDVNYEEQKKSILIVDDEQNILTGLKHLLHKKKRIWNIFYATGGKEALNIMHEKSIDIIIADMRMPVMTGVELLNIVKSQYPGTVRFILSAYSDREMIMRSIGSTHQFLTKPCDSVKFQAAIAKTFALRDKLGNDKIIPIIGDISKLPSLPDYYDDLQRKLKDPDCSVSDVEEIISSDVAMSAKILQLVNSAFFGVPRKIEGMRHALTLLGVEMIQSLVLTIHIFDSFSREDVETFRINKLYTHCVNVALASSRIMSNICDDQFRISNTAIAGMLHDAGKLVLMKKCPDSYRSVMDRSQKEQTSLHMAEQEEYGTSHAEIGAYLLGMWGLPDEIVEAVAYHHSPGENMTREILPLAAVHTANVLEHELIQDGQDAIALKMDTDYLKELALMERLPDFRKLCQELFKTK